MQVFTQDACCFCPILTKLQPSTQICFWNYPKRNFMKIYAVGVRQTDRHDKANSRFSQFSEYS